MTKLCFSLTCSFTGEHPDLADYCPCDTTLSDVLKEWPGTTPEPTEPFDSEYQYLAKEGGIPRRVLDRLEDAQGETRFQICRRLKELYPGESFWTRICDIQMSGIFDRETTFNFLDAIGAEFEDLETMGTIGGPLGWAVPDMSWTVESQALISCIRVTPVLCRPELPPGAELVIGQRHVRWEPVRPPSDWQWQAMRRVFASTSTYDVRQRRAFADSK